MQSKLNPYINFNGNAREVIEFYKEVLGGTLTISTYKDGGMSQSPDDADKVMHAMLVCDNGMTVMVADIPPSMSRTQGTNFSISISGDNEEELRGYWDKLSSGATVMMALEKAPWGDTFGSLTDKFGINWMINIAGKK